MKKALCFLLVILMLCPFHILAAEEVDWLAPIEPGPEEAVPGEPQGEAPGEYLVPGESQPEAPAESPAEAPIEYLEPTPADGPEPAQPDAGPDAEPDAGEEDPTVQMKVPSSGQVIINPYGYSVETNLGTTNEQVISTTQYLVSRSNVPISVSVEITGTHSNPDARFVAAEPDPSAKELFLYAEFQPVAEGEDPVWIGSYTGADCQVLINQSKEKTVTLPSGDDTPRKVAFRLFGAVSDGAGSGWTGSDSLSVTMSYKFDPLVEAEAADEEDLEARPEEENPENPEEDAVLTGENEDGQDVGEEPEITEEIPAETESPEETAGPIEEADSSEEDYLEIKNEADSEDSNEIRHERPSYRDEDEDADPPEYDANEDGIDWLAPSEATTELDDYESSSDDSEKDSDNPSQSTDHGDSGIAWLAPSDEDGEAGESEESEPPQEESNTGDGREAEEQTMEDDSSGIAWLSPTSE